MIIIYTMTNKNIILTIIGVIFIGVVSYLFVMNPFNTVSTNSNAIETEEISENTDMNEDVEDNSGGNNDQADVTETTNSEENSNSSSEEFVPTENAVVYEITDGTSVSYAVQKEYFGKPVERVVGTTDEVEGMGWIDLTNGSGQIEIKLDFDDLETSSPKRDEDILSLFESTEISIIGDLSNLSSVVEGTPFNLKLPLMVTINNVTKPVVFDVQGNLIQGKIQAQGRGMIKMSDFNVTAPSLVDVFAVSDDTELLFTLNGMTSTGE